MKDPVFNCGSWSEPTVLADVRQDMEIMQQEVFEPVIRVMAFTRSSKHCNWQTILATALPGFCARMIMNRIIRAVRDMECGELYINRITGESLHGYHAGWKQSGIGGDDGKHGLEHYLRRKTVYRKYKRS